MGDHNFETLKDALEVCDFSVFILTADKDCVKRGKAEKAANDNVIFEVGMFVGKLSRHKAYVVYQADSNLRLL